MNRMTLILTVAGAALALNACNKSEPGAAKEFAAAPTVLTELPARTPGLWEQTTSGTGVPNMTSTICLDAATDKKFSAMGAQGADCASTSINRGLDGSISFSSTCNMTGGGTVTSSGKISGNFSSEYTMEMQSETTGSPTAQMNGAHTMNVHMVRKGECPAGMAPGQITMSGPMKLPNGMTINIPPAPK